MKTQVLKFACPVLVKESYFTGNKLHTQLLKCQIISVSCYPNQQITFDLLVDGSFVYSNVSINELFHINTENKFNHNKFYGYTCKFNNDCEVFQYLFVEQHIYCYFGEETYKGQYCFSIDMVDDNQLFHFVKLENGHCVLIPNHKMTLKDVGLPKYIKNRNYASK